MTDGSQRERLILNGKDLTLKDIVRAARGIETEPGRFPEVRLSSEAAARLREVRQYIEENWLRPDAPTIYGFNSGVGKLKDTHIPPEVNDAFQKLMIESHCSGIGEAAPEEVVRATMLIRANALAKGVSGVRIQVVERLVEMLNRGVHPVIPLLGSVGASGDLAPMAHLVSALVGHPEAEVFYRGERLSAQEGLQRAGMEATFTMKAKDVLGMINGCTFTLGMAVLAAYDARRITALADIACALSMEAMRGEMGAFDPRIQEARNHPGQMETAANIRRLLAGSQWTTDTARKIKLKDEVRDGAWQPRVQDAYALRCVPQVHGAVLDVLAFVEQILVREANAATDNPLMFMEEDGEYTGLSGGNFHGEYLAFAMDFLTVAVHELGDISERRSARLLDPTMSYGLPRNLVGTTVGLNTGFTLAQCSAAALVSENKTLCFPASADSIPTKSNQEDHVSMSTWAARKAQMVIKNLFKILGIEILCAAQGISCIEEQLAGLHLAPATQKVYDRLRQDVPATGDDRYMNKQMRLAIALAENDAFLQ
ncbi:Fumarase/histidase, N-terminal [Acididesulfobacillus acetoxydans]|uniref:Fumarase/histidase, N-terminal n=1 Tax=Acididesulfobacillus acetoxydans TaxID=1561005 RepID=A0A8S0XAZ0_9FIRM|nr:aromatic amino acid ammonia-lyase [Acididesulfobacillus acetoxydans]CAA7600556.1 Fumarase/histidase, N-terminal [Acididesulfobacillus acetoxydans]CEJ06690.1 Histidine ammonia-lyase [Acididesulfobacillus acetoxydans]